MAYGLKYTLSFFSDRNNDYRIEILAKDYQGAPIAKKMGVAPVLNIAEGDGCIQGTSLTFAVQADVDGELLEFYTTDNKKFQVLLYRNGAIMWQGYLLPELYSEAYVAPPYDVSLTATDQLATLKDIEYSREDEQVLLQTVLEYLLSHTQLSLPLSYHMQLSVGLGRPMLENVYINQSAYNGSNCYDVLNAILLSMNCRIMQLGNQWLVTSATDNSENYYIERNLEVRPHKTLGQMYVADVYPNGTLGLVNSPALKGATLEYNHIFKKSILKNADCESRVGWEYMSHSSDDGRLPGEVTSFGKIFKAYCWQLMPKNIQKDASLHLWQDVEMPADDGVTWSLSFKHLFSTNAKLLLLAITHWDDRGVQRRLTGEGWVTQWDSANVNSYIQVTGTPKSASLAEYSDIEQYEMSTVQFTLPPSNGTLRIGFINSTANYADPLAFAPIYVTQVYLTLGAVSGSAATTTIEPNATIGQESVVLAMGDDVDSSNAVNVALNTLRRYDGGAIAGWMIGDRQFSSYFSMMLQEYSRYFGQKKRQLQGTIMGVDVLANIYKETYSNTVYRLISADYNLLADEANVTLEEVLSNFVQFAEQIFATNNSNSFGSPTSGGSFSGGSSSVDTSQLLRRDEAAETYATKAALADVNKEIAEINNDLDALNELLNSDVSGVINTWGEIVDFLDEYNESQDLASILSQMNSDIANRVHYDDFEKLQDAVDANYGAIQTLQGRVGIAEGTINSHTADIAANTKAITAIDNRVDVLEALGFVLKDGYIYTEKTIVSKGEIISGRRASGTSTDVGGGGGISSITAQMIADALGYVPYSSANPAGYINSSALNGYAKLTDIPSLNGYATEQYVTSRGYITGISSKMVTDALGYTPYNSVNFTKANIKATLGIADWALAASKPSYTASEVGALSTSGGVVTGDLTINSTLRVKNYLKIVAWPGYGEGTADMWYNGTTATIHSGASHIELYGNRVLHAGNYSSYVLPLSGGTIDSEELGALSIKRNATYAASLIKFENADGIIGYIGVSQNNVPLFSKDLQTYHTLIHSGNIGDYAMKYYGNQGAINFNDVLYNGIQYTSGSSSNNGKEYGVLASFWCGDSSWQIVGGRVGGGLLYRSGNGTSTSWGEWKTIAFTDGNIASATKLQTSRTIWGQSFDGTGNIEVTSYGMMRWLYFSNSGGTEQGYVGRGSDTNDIYLSTYGENALRFQTNNTLRASITSFGNVLIDTTTDSGYKLDVNGNVRLGGLTPKDGMNVIPFAVAMTDYANAGWVGSIGTQYGGVLLGHRYQANNNIDRTILGTSGAVALSINPDGGNVLIGATTDSGEKLQVNGIGKFEVSTNNLLLIEPATNSLDGSGIAFWSSGGWKKGTINASTLYLNNSSGGNVLIGTANDAGAKLNVVGGQFRCMAADVGTTYGMHHGFITGYHSIDVMQFFEDEYRFHSNGGGSACLVNVYGNLTATGEVISSRRASSSDRRLKDNITYLDTTDCLEMVRHIRPAEWDWKDNGKHSIGFIAQDVEHLMPYAVTSIKDDVLGQKLNLQYDQFSALAIGGVQAVDNEVQLLKREVRELKKKLAKYETQWQL